jgi:Holliday junction resolvase RusA-like endonuclease
MAGTGVMETLKYLIDNFDRSVVVIRSGYLFLDIKPQAKQSVSFGQGRAFIPKKKREYLAALAKQIYIKWKGPKIAGRVRLTIVYAFPWPQKERAMQALGWSLTDHRIDLDNLLKPVKDSLSDIVFGDDCQVVEVKARKIRYSRPAIGMKIDEIRGLSMENLVNPVSLETREKYGFYRG